MFTDESDDPSASSTWRDRHHELWLTMQTAHAEYRRASDILGLLMADIGTSGCIGGGRELEQARDEQRAAFENYIDSRLRFAELLHERAREQLPMHPTPRRASFVWLALTALTSALLGLLASCLIPSLEIGELKSERDRLRADLQASGIRLNALALRMNAVEKNLVEPSSQPARQAESSQQRSLPKVRPRGTKPLPIRFKQAHQEFTVRPSNAFARIGPVSLSFRRVDARRGDFDLYFSVRGSPVRKLHLRVYQPFRIVPGNPAGSIDLVINRVSASLVHGSISVPRRTEPVSESSISAQLRLANSRRRMPNPCLMDFK